MCSQIRILKKVTHTFNKQFIILNSLRFRYILVFYSLFKKFSIKYWTWWIAWAPFVGIFIALISKGRTVRELMIFILIAPTLFSCLWFLAFGEAAISLQLSQKFVGSTLEFKHTNLILFNMLDGFTQIPLIILLIQQPIHWHRW